MLNCSVEWAVLKHWNRKAQDLLASQPAKEAE